MRYVIAPEMDYLRVEVFDREAGPEWEDFLRQVASACRNSGRSRILIHSHGPSRMPVLAYYMLIKFAEALNVERCHRIALVVGADEFRQLDSFVQTVAPDGELSVMAFTNVAGASSWLLEESSQDPAICRGFGRRPTFPAAAANGDRP